MFTPVRPMRQKVLIPPINAPNVLRPLIVIRGQLLTCCCQSLGIAVWTVLLLLAVCLHKVTHDEGR